MASPLTANSVATFMNGEPVSGDYQPVMQCLSVKRINSPAGVTVDRYRVVLSDGAFFCSSMLATQMNHLVDSGVMDKNKVIKVLAFGATNLGGRKLMIVTDAEPVPFGADERIGKPENIETSSDAAAAPAPAPKKVSVPGAGPASKRAPGGAAGRASGTGPPGPLFPIQSLSPYQGRWTIKARVVNRSDIRTWKNERGEGKLANFTLIDESGEIRATAFNAEVDAFYDRLAEGKVFYLSQARVTLAKRQFSSVNNEYELMLDSSSQIEPCHDDDVPQVQYAFVTIEGLGQTEKDKIVDVIAVVHKVDEPSTINSKATNKQFAKRDIEIVDTSGYSVRLTLWGKQAETFNHHDNPVIAFKGVKVGDFGGRTLSMYSSSSMTVNPDIQDAHALRGWYDADGKSSTFSTHASGGNAGMAPGPSNDPIMTVAEAKEVDLSDAKPSYFSTKATVSFVRHETFSYPACPKDGCNKKLIFTGQTWRCEKDNMDFDAPVHRYILSMNVVDHTDAFWLTAFNEVAEVIMGKTANEMKELQENDMGEFDRCFLKVQAQEYVFSLNAKMETYQDTAKTRFTARRASPIDYAAESKKLITALEAM